MTKIVQLVQQTYIHRLSFSDHSSQTVTETVWQNNVVVVALQHPLTQQVNVNSASHFQITRRYLNILTLVSVHCH